jgi:hypothetical protein
MGSDGTLNSRKAESVSGLSGASSNATDDRHKNRNDLVCFMMQSSDRVIANIAVIPKQFEPEHRLRRPLEWLRQGSNIALLQIGSGMPPARVLPPMCPTAAVDGQELPAPFVRVAGACKAELSPMGTFWFFLGSLRAHGSCRREN